MGPFTNEYVKKEQEKDENMSNISWSITSNYGQLFMEQYTSIKQITKC